MKMTTEQFLSHFGIEVGKEFMWDEYKMKIDYPNSTLYKWFDGVGWVRSILEIGDLLDEEITPLPKYTLTDDEKAIVRSLKNDLKWIVRDKFYELFVSVNKPYKIFEPSLDWDNNGGCYYYIPMFHNVFNFIQWTDNEPVSLDELRKCL